MMPSLSSTNRITSNDQLITVNNIDPYYYDCRHYDMNDDPNDKHHNNDSHSVSSSSSSLKWRFLVLVVLIIAIIILLVLQTSMIPSSSLLSTTVFVLSWSTNVADSSNSNNNNNVVMSYTPSYYDDDYEENEEVEEEDHIDESDDTYGNTVLVQKHRQIQNNNEQTQMIRLPQFVGGWERLVDCPLSLGEAHGGIINNRYLLVTGGFINFTYVNRKTFLLDVAGDTFPSNHSWTVHDNFPYELGVTHAAEAFHKDKMYICGGYDGYPGLVQDNCYMFDRRRKPHRTNAPQYIPLPPLPAPRAGGGLLFDFAYNALLFVGGTRRNVTTDKTTLYDMSDTFLLDLNNTFGGWKNSTKKKPYAGNHISFVTVKDTCTVTRQGIQRHYIMGGQIGQNESAANLNHLYEYNIGTDEWIQRQPMPFGRGHTGTSVLAVGCGFIVAGGAINNINNPNQRKVTDDISYYSVVTDTWMSIGTLPRPLKTPVCGIVRNPIRFGGLTYLYCTTGYRDDTFRRQIVSILGPMPIEPSEPSNAPMTSPTISNNNKAP